VNWQSCWGLAVAAVVGATHSQWQVQCPKVVAHRNCLLNPADLGVQEKCASTILVYHNLWVMESLAEGCRTIHFLRWCLMEAHQTHMIVEGPSIDLKSTIHIRLVWPARTVLTDTEGMSHFDITFMYCALE